MDQRNHGTSVECFLCAISFLMTGLSGPVADSTQDKEEGRRIVFLIACARPSDAATTGPNFCGLNLRFQTPDRFGLLPEIHRGLICRSRAGWGVRIRVECDPGYGALRPGNTRRGSRSLLNKPTRIEPIRARCAVRRARSNRNCRRTSISYLRLMTNAVLSSTRSCSLICFR
jgi:hypothetical protein